MTANDRVRQRIAEWVTTHGHGSQRRIAKSVAGKYGDSKTDQWISDIINKRADLTLRDLDAIAEVLDVAPGWLVRKPDRNYEELTMTESKVIRYFRQMPDTVRHAWVLCLDYLFSAQESRLSKEETQRTLRTQNARKHEHEQARRPGPKTPTAHERAREA